MKNSRKKQTFILTLLLTFIVILQILVPTVAMASEANATTNPIIVLHDSETLTTTTTTAVPNSPLGTEFTTTINGQVVRAFSGERPLPNPENDTYSTTILRDDHHELLRRVLYFSYYYMVDTVEPVDGMEAFNIDHLSRIDALAISLVLEWFNYGTSGNDSLDRIRSWQTGVPALDNSNTGACVGNIHTAPHSNNSNWPALAGFSRLNYITTPTANTCATRGIHTSRVPNGPRQFLGMTAPTGFVDSVSSSRTMNVPGPHTMVWCNAGPGGSYCTPGPNVGDTCSGWCPVWQSDFDCTRSQGWVNQTVQCPANDATCRVNIGLSNADWESFMQNMANIQNAVEDESRNVPRHFEAIRINTPHGQADLFTARFGNAAPQPNLTGNFTPEIGEEVEWEIILENENDFYYQDLELRFNIPQDMLVVGDIGVSNGLTPVFNPETGEVIISIPYLGAESSVSITINVLVRTESAGETITIELNLYDVSEYPRQLLSSGTGIINVQEMTVPTITSTTNQDTATVGEIVEFEIQLTNHHNVLLNDFLFTSVVNQDYLLLANQDARGNTLNVMVNGLPHAYNFDSESGELSINFGQLSQNGVYTITYFVMVLLDATDETVTTTHQLFWEEELIRTINHELTVRIFNEVNVDSGFGSGSVSNNAGTEMNYMTTIHNPNPHPLQGVFTLVVDLDLGANYITLVERGITLNGGVPNYWIDSETYYIHIEIPFLNPGDTFVDVAFVINDGIDSDRLTARSWLIYPEKLGGGTTETPTVETTIIREPDISFKSNLTHARRDDILSLTAIIENTNRFAIDNIMARFGLDPNLVEIIAKSIKINGVPLYNSSEDGDEAKLSSIAFSDGDFVVPFDELSEEGIYIVTFDIQIIADVTNNMVIDFDVFRDDVLRSHTDLAIQLTATSTNTNVDSEESLEYGDVDDSDGDDNDDNDHGNSNNTTNSSSSGASNSSENDNDSSSHGNNSGGILPQTGLTGVSNLVMILLGLSGLSLGGVFSVMKSNQKWQKK